MALALTPWTFIRGEAISGTISQPTIDYLFYPFVGDGGTRGSTLYSFGATGSTGFDNRDAQDFFQFNTSTLVTPGLSASSYQVKSVTLTLYYAGNSSLLYDPTYDSYTTVGPNATAVDSDAGRPMELFGSGYRYGYTSSTVGENMPFTNGTMTGTFDHFRNVFASDFAGGTGLNNGSARDISNNVSDAFEVAPFAIGQVDPSKVVNGLVQKNAAITFTLNLTPDVINYLQLSLQDGRMGFVASSLLGSSQGGTATYPSYYPKENLIELPATLALNVEVVPEPGAFVMLACGLAGLGATRRTARALRLRKADHV